MGQSLDREPIIDALARRLEALCPSLETVTRKYRTQSSVDASEKPWAYVGAPTQQAVTRRGAPSFWNLDIPVLLYFQADEGDTTTPPSTLLNAVVKEVEDALERQATTETVTDSTEPYSTNLGLRNVKAVRLVTVDTDEGLLDVHGMAGLVIHVEAIPG